MERSKGGVAFLPEPDGRRMPRAGWRGDCECSAAEQLLEWVRGEHQRLV